MRRTFALAAATGLLLLAGCKRERAQRYGNRDYEQPSNVTERHPVAGMENEVDKKYDKLAAADASGGEQRYRVARIDGKERKLVLEAVGPTNTEGKSGAVKENQAGIEMQAQPELALSFDDFDKLLAPEQPIKKAADLKQGQQVAVYLDSKHAVSRIVVDKDKAEKK